MRLTVEGKEWKYIFDKEVTYDLICFLFVLNYLQTGSCYILEKDFYTLLFLIDVISLELEYHLVTGDEWFIDDVTSSVIAKEILLELNKDWRASFTRSYNNLGQMIITCNIIQDLVNVIEFDHLCEYTEELADKVYKQYIFLYGYKYLLNKLLVEKAQLCSVLPNTNIKYISLDYLIDVLSLDKEAITEMLALHNVGR